MKQLISFLVIIILSSCSPLKHLNKFQYNISFNKSERKNFSGPKAKTQWWYFDCFLDDGSMIVFLMNPHQWWSKDEKTDSSKSFLYFSYLSPKGEVISGQKLFDFSELTYDEKGLQCPYFELLQNKTSKERNYTIYFNLEEIKGSMNIISSSKIFSPLPTSSMGEWATRHILKLKGKGLAFRYASYVPQGAVVCNLEVKGKKIQQSGKAYHEQGWFTGDASQMGAGWTWFHFVSKNINVFGKPGDFICLEKDGKRIVGGIAYKNFTFTNKVFAPQYEGLAMGGDINFKSRNAAFVVSPIGQKPTALIYLPSSESDQLWGTVAQSSTITLSLDGKEVTEEGILIIETCSMEKNTGYSEKLAIP